MKRGTTAIIVLLAFAVGLATVSAYAQGMGGGMGGGGHKHQKQTDKTEQKPKADDKAYNAALKGIPDKPKPDPWQGAR